MSDSVQVDKALYLDPRVENEDGSFGALKPGYRDPTTHMIQFDEDPVEYSQDESEPVVEPEKDEVEPEVGPQNTEDGE